MEYVSGTAIKWRVFAFDVTTGAAVTGDAANISAKVAKDFGTATALTISDATEIEDGYYYMELSTAETTAGELHLYPESSTADVQVIGDPPSMSAAITTALINTAVEGGQVGTDATAILADTVSIESKVDIVTVDTNELQTDWVDGGRLDLILDQVAVDAAAAGTATISAKEVSPKRTFYVGPEGYRSRNVVTAKKSPNSGSFVTLAVVPELNDDADIDTNGTHTVSLVGNTSLMVTTIAVSPNGEALHFNVPADSVADSYTLTANMQTVDSQSITVTGKLVFV